MLHSTDFLRTLGGSATGERLARIERSPNFRDGIFQNLWPTTVMIPGKSMEVAKEWMSARDRRRPAAPLPTVPLTRESFANAPADGVRVCWLGHSTVLLQLEGSNVLFDPVWSKRSSPSRLVGPTRFQPVPLPINQLPLLTAVVISHDHYDHLDADSIQQIAGEHPEVPFFAPLGVGAHLERWGVAPERIHELDWWEEAQVTGRLKLVSAPARHFSGRGVFDRNKTQWASWVVIGGSHRVFFGGDTGYHPAMADIGQRFGPFDLTMLEIGAFNPNWGLIHLGPENALKAQKDLAGKKLMPIHWGAFDLGTHPWDEPVATLFERAPAEGVELLVPRIGQLVDLADAPAPVAWWTE